MIGRIIWLCKYWKETNCDERKRIKHRHLQHFPKCLWPTKKTKNPLVPCLVFSTACGMHRILGVTKMPGHLTSNFRFPNLRWNSEVFSESNHWDSNASWRHWSGQSHCMLSSRWCTVCRYSNYSEACKKSRNLLPTILRIMFYRYVLPYHIYYIHSYNLSVLFSTVASVYQKRDLSTTLFTRLFGGLRIEPLWGPRC